MFGKIYNMLLNPNDNLTNKNKILSNPNDNLTNDDDSNNYVKKKLSEYETNLLNNLLDSCLNLYDPEINNYDLVITKFYSDYSNSFDYKDYLKLKQMLLNKMLEKKEILANMKKNIEYYCVYMSTNQIIKICKTDYLLRFIDNNQNILYCIEYIDTKLSNIDKIVEKYSKLYKCKIEIC
jgi:hypothetical protein